MQPATSALARLRQEGHEFEIRQGYRKSMEGTVGSDLQGLSKSAEGSQARKSKVEIDLTFILIASQATTLSVPRGHSI